MSIDPRRLVVWHAVVSTGSIKQAAIDLGFSSSAISQQVAALQRETGTTLLEPDGRGVRATPAGRVLADRAANVLAELAEAEAELAAMQAGRLGMLRVGAFASAGAELVPRALSAVRRTLPQIDVSLRSLERDDAFSLLARGLLDVAVVESHAWIAPPDHTALATQPLLTDPYRVVLPRGHRLARRRQVELGELRDEPWIRLRSEVGCCHTATTRAFDEAGFSPSWIAEADDYWPAQGFVAAGLGVALVPALALGVVHAEAVIRELDPHHLPTRDVAVVTRPSIRDTPAVAAMSGALAEAARQQPRPLVPPA